MTMDEEKKTGEQFRTRGLEEKGKSMHIDCLFSGQIQQGWRSTPKLLDTLFFFSEDNLSSFL